MQVSTRPANERARAGSAMKSKRRPRCSIQRPNAACASARTGSLASSARSVATGADGAAPAAAARLEALRERLEQSLEARPRPLAHDDRRVDECEHRLAVLPQRLASDLRLATGNRW
jgi:hypothetical protein